MQEGEIGDGAFDFDACASSRRGTASVKWDTPSEEGVLPLWVADMDFRVAPAIVEALRRRVDDGVFGYALPPPAWHESLARWLSRRHGLTVAPDTILDATGVIPALAAVLRAICGHDGKVVIQTPVYGSFFTTIRNQGLEIVESPLRRVPARNAADGDFTYEMDFDDLERKVSVPGVRLFLLCNPHNPVGRAWTAEELRRAGEICLRHGVFIASDEMHADLQMPGSCHVPFASISDGFAASSVLFMFMVDIAFNKVLEPHQQKRIMVTLGIADDPRGAGYNVNQSKIAIGSGGIMGKGFLNGTQTKLKYVPEQHTDFIYCTIGEEKGFVGSVAVLLLYLALILRIITLAERNHSTFARVYAYCVASYLIFHLTINIGMVIGLCPVIGIPLPFYSYGGSSLWGFTILLFILLRLDADRGNYGSW